MFLGLFTCLIVYFCKACYSKINTAKQLEKMQNDQPVDVEPSTLAKSPAPVSKTKINPLWFAIPAAFDCAASSLMFIGLTQTAASVYQMMRGAIVIFTALFSVIFLKKKQYAHHLISLVVIVSGLALVGWFSVAESEK